MTPENKKIWESALSAIELTVSKANFNTWFKDAFITKIDEGVVVLGVPNAFVKDWLYNKFHKLIVKVLRDLLPSVRAVEYIILKNENKNKESSLDKTKNISLNTNTNELPLADLYINREDNLNPKYIFDTFVVGPFNENAHAAAQAIIKQPGIVYNPFFVYGNTGHGKTHLIQAIGNYIKNVSKDKKIFYITSEKFYSEFTGAIQLNKINLFKEKYRKYDIFIMDDVQFLSKKEATQEELFHLFNTLYENNKQIVFSSDRHPNFIPDLADRLKSRFAQGIIMDIPAPDHESRAAILKTKTQNNNFPLTDEVIQFLASSIEGNIRELEGVLNSIMCQTKLKGRDLGLAEIKNIIKNNAKPKKMVSVKEVIKTIANFYNIEEKSVTEKTRKKEVVKPRQIAMFILREDFNVSYPTIGEKLGGRDHTTVMHSCEKIKNDLKIDNRLAEEINQIRAML